MHKQFKSVSLILLMMALSASTSLGANTTEQTLAAQQQKSALVPGPGG